MACGWSSMLQRFPDSSDADVAELQSVIDSIQLARDT